MVEVCEEIWWQEFVANFSGKKNLAEICEEIWRQEKFRQNCGFNEKKGNAEVLIS